MPNTTRQTAIQLEKVSKVFKKNKKAFIAVDKISLKIPKGEIFGLLGPNGAGKTTTLSMICTLLRPTSGKILLDNIDVQKDETAARQRIGLVFQETTLDKELTGWENLEFHARLYKVKERDKRVKEALELVGLMADKDVVVKSYSGGMKRRLEIGRSIIHDPAFILLDEPTLGLDPISRREMWKYIKLLIEKKGVTVILTTHYLEEAERLCKHIAIIDKGKIVVQGTPDELKAKISNDTVRINLKKMDSAVVERLKLLPGVKKATVDGNEITLSVKEADKHIVQLVQQLGDAEVVGLQVRKPSLDDVFVHYAGHEYGEDK